MTWARVSSCGIAVAVALIILANAPAVLMDPLFTAVAQIRVNAATTNQPAPDYQSETTGTSVTSVKRK